MGQTGSEHDSVLRFPLALPPFAQPHGLFILAPGGVDQRPAVIGGSDGGRFEVGHPRDQDGILRAAFLLGRAHHPLPGRATEAMGDQDGRPLAARPGGGLPRPDVLASRANPPALTDCGNDLIAATHHPVQHLGGPNAPVQAEDARGPALAGPSQTRCHLTQRRFECGPSRRLAPEQRLMEELAGLTGRTA
jgi:hypothetical protein